MTDIPDNEWKLYKLIYLTYGDRFPWFGRMTPVIEKIANEMEFPDIWRTGYIISNVGGGAHHGFTEKFYERLERESNET